MMTETTEIIRRWKTPATAYAARRHGRAEITKERRPLGGCYYAEGVRGRLFVRYGRGTTITLLKIGGRVWMTDEFPYTASLESFAERARGSVLVAGLGLGIVVHQLARNPAVTNITVVERENDVLNLVGPLLPEDKRVGLVQGDFYAHVEREAAQGVRRDTVIWDLGLWGGEGREEGRDMILLVKPLMAARYGAAFAWDGKDWSPTGRGNPGLQVFVHGLDRDPEGERFVRENPALILATKAAITDVERRRAEGV